MPTIALQPWRYTIMPSMRSRRCAFRLCWTDPMGIFSMWPRPGGSAGLQSSGNVSPCGVRTRLMNQSNPRVYHGICASGLGVHGRSGSPRTLWTLEGMLCIRVFRLPPTSWSLGRIITRRMLPINASYWWDPASGDSPPLTHRFVDTTPIARSNPMP